MTGTQYHRRVTSCRAEKVTHANLAELAAWSKGSTWAASVIVPGEIAAPIGSWLVKIGPAFEVWTDEAFRTQWAPVKEVYQPVVDESQRASGLHDCWEICAECGDKCAQQHYTNRKQAHLDSHGHMWTVVDR